MATKPSSDPLWATDAGANVSEPSSQRTLGYPNGFVPPAGAHNWQFQTIGDWIDYLDQVAAPYDELHEAAADMADGETAIVNSADPGGVDPFELEVSVASGSASTNFIHSDGESVFVGMTTATQRRDRATLAVVEQAYVNGGGAGPIEKILSNGEYVVGFHDQILEVWTRDGTHQFSFDHQGLIRDIALGSTHVAIVGVRNGTNTASFEVFQLSTGSNTGTYDHGADLWGIDNWGNDFYVYGAAGGTGSTKRVLRLNTSGSVIWELDAPAGAAISGTDFYQAIAVNSKRIVLHNGVAGILMFGKDREDLLANGTNSFLTPLWASSWTATDSNLWFDHKYLYAYNGGTNTLVVVDPVTGSAIGSLSTSAAGKVTCDGDRIFEADDTNDVFVKRHTAYAAQRWTKSSGNDKVKPQVMIASGLY